MSDAGARRDSSVGTVRDARGALLHRRFPSVAHLREGARRRLPRFAFEYMDGGAGADGGIGRNAAALDAVELVPRYGVADTLPSAEVTLFGRTYAAPFGIAPMGGPAIGWPGADACLAEAAQRAGVPYTLGTIGSLTIERAAEIAPDVLWYQIYRMPNNDHAIGNDLVQRAWDAGVHVLVLTMDVPVRTSRPREVVAGITTPFRRDLRMLAGILGSPGYLAALLRHGQPRFANLQRYVGEQADAAATAQFVKREMIGAFTWEDVARYRDRWPRALVVKGVMHPGDAEKAVGLGVDGITVSNHGGRQVEALAASIDVLPAIADAAGERATVLFDSGIRSGQDVVRALALGAEAAFAGKAFLWGLGALGREGPSHVIALIIEELRATLGQIGARSPTLARAAAFRHADRLSFPPEGQDL